MREAALVAQRLAEVRESETVDLQECGLMDIPMAMFIFTKGVNVKEVNVSQNQLKKLPLKLIKSFTTLTILNCSNNKLKQLPNMEDCELKALKAVNLSCNQLSNVPIQLPLSLDLLDLSENSISTLSDEEISFMKVFPGKIILTGNALDEKAISDLTKLSLDNVVL